MKKTIPVFALALALGAVSVGIFLLIGFSGTSVAPNRTYGVVLTEDEQNDDEKSEPNASKELTFELAPRGNEYTVTGISGRAARIAIPSTFGENELPVTSIADGAFAGNDYLISVTLPQSLLQIGSEAFSGCKKLAAIDFPDSLAIIGDRAFYGCCGLADIVMPLSLNTVGDFAFFGCTSARRIFCEAEAKPAGWSDCWCGYTGVEVLWRGFWRYTGNIPTPDPSQRG